MDPFQRGVALAMEARQRGLLDEQALALVLAYYENEGAQDPMPAGAVLQRLGGVSPAAVVELTRAQAGGRRFNERLTVLDTLGEGGMGSVYRAYDGVLKRTVALKVIRPDKLDDDGRDRALARFEREAQAMARVRHPSCVQIFDVGLGPKGEPYLVMEFVEGSTLADLIGGSPQGLDPSHAARLGAAVAEALQACHEQGIVHRDVKPANVLIDAEGNPRLTDFGIAAAKANQRLTEENMAIGTLDYLPPEQAGGAEADARSDVYALGATLYQAICGEPILEATNAVEMLRKIVGERPQALRKRRPGTPRDLETVIHKCLEKDPQHRYPSAKALARDLRRFLDDEPVLARPIGASERAWRWVRRRPGTAGGVLVAALLASLGGGWAWSALRDTQEQLGESEREREELAAARAKIERAAELLRRLQETLRYRTLPLQETPEAEAELVARARGELEEILGELRGLTEEAPRPAQVYVIQARAHHALFDLEKAEACALRASEADPQLGEAPLVLGRVLMKRYTLEETVFAIPEEEKEARKRGAQEAFARALELGQKLDDLNVAWSAYASGDLVAAGEALDAIPAHRADESVAYLRALLAMRGGDEDGLLEHLNAALRLCPRLPEALMRRSYVFHTRGQTERSRDDLSLLIAVRPDYGLAYMERGNRLQRLQKLEEALLDYDRGIELDPTAIAYMNRANAKMQLGRLDEALEDVNTSLRMRPKSAKALANRGNIRGLQGDLEGAIADYTAAIAIEPNWGFFLSRATHRQEDDPQGALEDYAEAVRQRPERVEIYYARAGLYSHLGKQAESLADYDRVLELDPTNVGALYNRGVKLHIAGRVQEALRDYAALIEHAPPGETVRVAKVRHNLGTLRERAGDWRGALQQYEASIRLDPRGQARAYGRRGVIRLEHLKDLRGALADLEVAVRLEPTFSEHLLFRGLAHDRLGNARAAAADYEEALRLDPRNPQGKAMRRFIEKTLSRPSRY